MRGGAGGGGGPGAGGGEADLLRQIRALVAAGNGGGGNGGARAARNARAAGARANGGGGGGNVPAAGGARARSVAPAGARQEAAADWGCSWCGFTPNFARRRFCFDCGKPRARVQGAAALSDVAAKAPTYLGPVGADGRRPQLAWGTKHTARQGADVAPTRRTPGASAAALAEEAKRNGACPTPTVHSGSGTKASSASGHQGASRTTADEDGFITVGKRGKPVAPAPPSAPIGGRHGVSAQGNEAKSMGANCAPSESRSAARDDADDAEADEEEAEGGESAPGPDALRRAWMDEVALVKRLARQGMPEGHPALVAAHEARDAAEAAWRKAKQPAPAATRLRWAQEKLSRALELQEASRAAIEQAEADHQQLMARLRQRHDDDIDRVRKRRQGVDDIQEEIGLDTPNGKSRSSKTAAMFEVCGGLCNNVGHGLVALVEMLQDGSAEQQAANKVLATLSDSQRRLEEVAGGDADRHQACDTFDIGDGEDEGDAMSQATAWSESHEVHESGGGTGADGAREHRSEHGAYNESAVGGEPIVGQGGWNRWTQRQWNVPQWQTDQHGKWHRASWADQWEAEHGQAAGWASCRKGAPTQETRNGADGNDSDNGEPSAKHRRQQVEDVSMESGGSSASAVEAGTGTAGATSYAAQVEDIVNKAINAGVQPLTETGAELITLSREQLSQWVATHLEPKFGW